MARYNAAIQHQTIQHTVTSPLLKARVEVLSLIEQLSEKQYNDVAEMIIPVGFQFYTFNHKLRLAISLFIV